MSYKDEPWYKESQAARTALSTPLVYAAQQDAARAARISYMDPSQLYTFGGGGVYTRAEILAAPAPSGITPTPTAGAGPSISVSIPTAAPSTGAVLDPTQRAGTMRMYAQMPAAAPPDISQMRLATPQEAVALASRLAAEGKVIPTAGAIYVKKTTVDVLGKGVDIEDYYVQPKAEATLQEARVEARGIWEGAAYAERQEMGKSALWAGDLGFTLIGQRLVGEDWGETAIEAKARMTAAEREGRLAQYQAGSLAGGVFSLIALPVVGYAVGAGVGIAQTGMEQIPSFTKGKVFQYALPLAGAGLYAPRAIAIQRTYAAGEKAKALGMIIKDVGQITTFGIGFKKGYLEYAPYPGKELGLVRGETITQPGVQEIEAYGAGTLDMEFGKTPYKAVAKGERVFGVFQQEAGVSGISKEIGADGARISLFDFKPGRAGEEFVYGIGYDISVPAAEKGVTKTTSVWEIYRPKTVVVTPPATRFYGGYGAVPRYDIEWERVVGTTSGIGELIGDPKVIKEWVIGGTSWRDPGKEMMKLLSGSKVAGIGISAEGFTPYRGTGAFELTTQVLGAGGGGGMQLPRFKGPTSLGGGEGPAWAVKGAEWAGMDLRAGITAVSSGRAAAAAEYKAGPVRELWSGKAGLGEEFLTGLEREGYLRKRQKAELESGMESAMRSASKQASRLRSEQKQALEQQSGLESALTLGQKQASMQKQALQSAQKVMLELKTDVPTTTTTRFDFGPPTGAWSLGPRKLYAPKKRKISYKLPRGGRRLQYAPTLLGVELAKQRPQLGLKRAPKEVGVSAIGIRMPVLGRLFAPKKKKRVNKKAKRAYEKRFFAKLGI